jgi:glutathione peroxidase-family protein
MSSFKGKKAFLVVNVASECIHSSENYKWMAKMIGLFPDLQIITYPCDQFCGSESGTAD